MLVTQSGALLECVYEPYEMKANEDCVCDQRVASLSPGLGRIVSSLWILEHKVLNSQLQGCCKLADPVLRPPSLLSPVWGRRNGDFSTWMNYVSLFCSVDPCCICHRSQHALLCKLVAPGTGLSSLPHLHFS